MTVAKAQLGAISRQTALTQDQIFISPVTNERFRKCTKQIATCGPASCSFEMVERLFLAGADVFRLNFSHGKHAEKTQLVAIIRQVERKYNHPIAILADLQVSPPGVG